MFLYDVSHLISVGGKLTGIAIIILWAGAGCTPTTPSLSPSTPELSQIKATSITSPASAGHGQRCDELYPDVYRVSMPILAALMSRYQDMQQNTLDPPIVPYNRVDVAKEVLTHTRTMLLNMMRHPQRPIHPAGFFSVVKDFESTLHASQWSSGNHFLFTSTNCSSQVCSGYFQVDVNIEPLWHHTKLCGRGGLNILGLKGSADFCAFLFWFHAPSGGLKCRKMQHTGDPCRDSTYTWTPNTFARGGELAYIQKNPWKGPFNIHDPWGKIYTGLHNQREFHPGYEHCSIEYYLKQYWSAPQDWRAPQDLSAYADILRAAVRHYGYEIGLLPPWAPNWTPSHLESPKKNGKSIQDSGLGFHPQPTNAMLSLIHNTATTGKKAPSKMHSQNTSAPPPQQPASNPSPAPSPPNTPASPPAVESPVSIRQKKESTPHGPSHHAQPEN